MWKNFNYKKLRAKVGTSPFEKHLLLNFQNPSKKKKGVNAKSGEGSSSTTMKIISLSTKSANPLVETPPIQPSRANIMPNIPRPSPQLKHLWPFLLGLLIQSKNGTLTCVDHVSIAALTLTFSNTLTCRLIKLGLVIATISWFPMTLNF